MPRAGYCSECKKNVWLKEDGSCLAGHPASSVKDPYHVPQKENTNTMEYVFDDRFKRTNLALFLVTCLAFILWGLAFTVENQIQSNRVAAGLQLVEHSGSAGFISFISFALGVALLVAVPIWAAYNIRWFIDSANKVSSATTSIYAGFWIRAGALMFDLYLWGIVIALSDKVITSLGRQPINTNSNVLYPLLMLFLLVAYFSIMESSPLQATLGKLFFRIKVTDLQGQRISFGRSLVRTFAKGFSQILLFWGYWKVAYSNKKQALHDDIADTLVLKQAT